MTFLRNLTLGKKITLLTAVGLLLGVGVFSSLGIRAANQATETMLQDRLTTARLVADYLDEALERSDRRAADIQEPAGFHRLHPTSLRYKWNTFGDSTYGIAIHNISRNNVLDSFLGGGGWVARAKEGKLVNKATFLTDF